MSIELIILIAALIVSWLVFTALIEVVKTTVSTALAIAAIVLALQLVFGVGPQEIWQQLSQLPQILSSWKKFDFLITQQSFLSCITSICYALVEFFTG